MPQSSQVYEWLGKAGLFGFCLFSPFSIAGAEISLGIALFGWLASALFNRSLAWRHTVLDWAVSVLLLAVLASAFFGVDPKRSLVSLKDFFPLTLLFVALNFPKDPRSAERLLTLLAAAVSVAALNGIYQHFSGMDWIHHGPLNPTRLGFRAQGTFSTIMTYSEYHLLAGLFFLTLAMSPSAPFKRILYGMAGQLSVVALLFSYARGAFLALAGGLLAYFFLAPRGKKFFPVAFTVAVGLVTYLASPDLISRFEDLARTGRDESVGNSRLDIWQTTLAIFADHPVTGIGFGNFETLYDRYRTNRAGRILGHAHNDWLNFLVHSGVVGLAAFILFWLAVLRVLWQGYRHAGDQARFYPLAALVAGCGYLVVSQIEAVFFDEEVLLLLCFLVGIGLRGVAGKAEASDTSSTRAGAGLISPGKTAY